jgi:hypothetical protein
MIYLSDTVDDEAASNHATANSNLTNKGMVLPFVPLSITFEDIRYSVDMPEVFNFFETIRIKSIHFSDDYEITYIHSHACSLCIISYSNYILEQNPYL